MLKIASAILKALGQLLFLFGLLGWTYGVAWQIVYPHWITWGLSHLTPNLRIDIFAIYSFITSAAGFFLWRLTKELTDATQQAKPR